MIGLRAIASFYLFICIRVGTKSTPLQSVFAEKYSNLALGSDKNKKLFSDSIGFLFSTSHMRT